MAEAAAVGKPEIADLLEVERATPAQWIRRRNQSADPFPLPDHPPVNGMDAWRPETILAWAARTGRTPRNGVRQ